MVSSKKQFLEVEDTSQLYRQSYVKDMESMSHFLNGTYLLINQLFEYGESTPAYPELIADNIKPVAGFQPLYNFYSWNQIVAEDKERFVFDGSKNMGGVWNACYSIIRACDFIIEDVDKYRAENPAKADDIKGQALALRALAHFKLVNIFAQPYNFTPEGSHPGIPYIVTADISRPYSRQSVAEVFNAMISDLSSAAALLPAAISDTRYMNQAAAKALLARVYLFKQDYTNANLIAKQVCTQFPLLSIANGYPNSLFVNKPPSASEILYRLTPGQDNTTRTSTLFLGVVLSPNYQYYNATDDIANLYQEFAADIRNNWISGSAGAYRVSKYPLTNVAPEINPPTYFDEGGHYYPIIRSSEMFLTVAEASAKTNDENTARMYLNAVRTRAGIPAISTSGPALLDSIYKERRKELAFEGHRLYDLQRWNLGVHRIDVLGGAPTDLPFPSNRLVSPIPLRDVQLMGLQQNPGY